MSNPAIGIVGCGAAAKRYYVPAFKKFSETTNRLVLVDKNRSQAEDLARELGGGRIFSDYRDILDSVRGVIIALPHFLHFPVSMEFLRAGVHVLCEKPLAETGDQITEMMAVAEETKVALCVNNTMRTFPSFVRTKEIIASGQVGELKSITFHVGNEFAWPSATGFYVDPRVSRKGVLFDVGAHILDLVCWWTDAKPSLDRYEDDSHGGPESVSHLQAHANGCQISIVLNRLYDLDNTFKVVGELGTIEGKLFEWNKLKVTTSKTVVTRLRNSRKTYPEFVLPVVDNFIRVIQGKCRPLVSGHDVQRSIQLIEDCYRTRPKYRWAGFGENDNTPRGDGKVLVTGATGFIGGSIVETLYSNNDRRVVAGIRKWSSAARLGRFPVEIVELDLMRMEDIHKALDGVTEIVHCAKGPEGVTVQGTRNLLEAASKKEIKRFVHLSTAEVYGNVNGLIDEESPFVYTGNEYNRTKIDAEKVCWEYLEKRVPITILRPSIVYGPHSKNWTVHIAKMLIEKKWGVFENLGEGKCNLIYIDDLVKAALLSLEVPSSIGQAFNICNSEAISWNEYFVKFNIMLGLPPIRIISASQANLRSTFIEPARIAGRFVKNHFMMPVKKVADTFHIIKIAMKDIEDAIKATPSPEEFGLLKKTAVLSSRKAKGILGFTPDISLDFGLERTVSWLREQGILPVGET